MAKSKKGGIIFSAHIGNWEIGPKSLIASNLKVKIFYRPLNNFLVEKITAKMRKTPLISKNNGIREIVRSISQGYYIVVMVDQKISEGQKIPFFHQDAYTSDLIAKIALKYKVDLIGARVIRKNSDFDFIVEIDQPLVIDQKDDAKSIMIKINRKLENWIKQYPSQWFWVHNRWKK
jgi:KDO2-lipid IV(A) lauroyltransferase